MSPKPFGFQYGLERGETFVDVPVYKHVIIFGPVVDFHCGALEPGLDLMGQLRCARMDAPRKFFRGRGRIKTRTTSLGNRAAMDAAPCQSTSKRMSRPSRSAALTGPADVPVQVPEHLGPLKQIAACLQVLELLSRDEGIVDAFLLPGTAAPASLPNRATKRIVARQQKASQGCLPAPEGDDKMRQRPRLESD